MSDAKLPPLPSLRALTAELRALHEAWSHPDAGGEYVGLVDAGPQVGWVLESPPHPDLIGREYIPGSVELECGCRSWPIGYTVVACGICHGSGRVSSPDRTFDAVAAARRLLAAAREGLK